MYSVTKHNKYYAVSVVDDNGDVLINLSVFNTEPEARYWCDKLTTSYDIGYNHGMQLGDVIDKDDIPQWLKEDVKTLALEEVRLSCAIHDLYKHYADAPTNHMGVDERSKFLSMVNERLDWIDSNTNIIEYTINNLWKLEDIV